MHFSDDEQRLMNWPESAHVEVLPILCVEVHGAIDRNLDQAQSYGSDPLRSYQGLARQALSSNVTLRKLAGELRSVGQEAAPELFPRY